MFVGCSQLAGTPFVKLGGGFNDLYDEDDEDDSEFSDNEPETKEEPVGAIRVLHHSLSAGVPQSFLNVRTPALSFFSCVGMCRGSTCIRGGPCSCPRAHRDARCGHMPWPCYISSPPTACLRRCLHISYAIVYHALSSNFDMQPDALAFLQNLLLWVRCQLAWTSQPSARSALLEDYSFPPGVPEAKNII